MSSKTFEKAVLNEQDIRTLWNSLLDANQNDSVKSQRILLNDLRQTIASIEQSPTEAELYHLMQEVDLDASGAIEFEEFRVLMTSRHGDRTSRLKLAFQVFDEDNDGQISADELRQVMTQFGLTDSELDEMIQEVDLDGDHTIDFKEFCQLVSPELAEATGYRDQLEFSDRFLDAIPTVEHHSTGDDPEQPLPLKAGVGSLTLTHLGTSRLQTQIGLFRLIQGAAYRCFRESFCANHQTHLRVKNLPYRITDFVSFVRDATLAVSAKQRALYKALGIVEPACYPVLDALVTSILDEYDRLEARIQQWQTLEKTPEMLVTEQAMLAARGKSATVQEKFTAGVEFAITLKKKRLSLADVAEGVLAIHELDRLRKMEAQENDASVAEFYDDPKTYLKQWNRVILSETSETVDGAMMPVAYWYEDFMPKLIAAFSVSTAADIEPNTQPNEEALTQWFEAARSSGEFDRFGTDIATGFLNCTVKQKLMLKQAWRLTRPYLNGVQKRRERLECGRESGTLSQYVAFIDVYLGQRDMQTAQMRLSYPYYLGPVVWRFFHTTAELVCEQSIAHQMMLVEQIKTFFYRVAALYPCPYCRHHLNLYVVQNREVEMYPVEYLMLGCDSQLADFVVSIDAKLSTLVDGASLRLFFWKLHNTVSVSISRSEVWYHQDDKAFYTSRYYPSLEAELSQAKVLGKQDLNYDRVSRLYDVLKSIAQLSSIRLLLRKQLEQRDRTSINSLCLVAQTYIQELEAAVLKGQFLQDLYRFDPELIDPLPQVTLADEAFARTNVFLEICE